LAAKLFIWPTEILFFGQPNRVKGLIFLEGSPNPSETFFCVLHFGTLDRKTNRERYIALTKFLFIFSKLSLFSESFDITTDYVHF
jgi:hypothetical protein